MTSKEIIIAKIKEKEDYLKRWGVELGWDLTNEVKKEIEDLKLILADLERLEKQDKILEILEPYAELKYDNVNDEYNLIIDASERILLSEDYDINRVILGIDDYEAMPIKEWLGNDK